jgi:hypothetical protein
VQLPAVALTLCLAVAEAIRLALSLSGAATLSLSRAETKEALALSRSLALSLALKEALALSRSLALALALKEALALSGAPAAQSRCRESEGAAQVRTETAFSCGLDRPFSRGRRAVCAACAAPLPSSTLCARERAASLRAIRPRQQNRPRAALAPCDAISMQPAKPQLIVANKHALEQLCAQQQALPSTAAD